MAKEIIIPVEQKKKKKRRGKGNKIAPLPARPLPPIGSNTNSNTISNHTIYSNSGSGSTLRAATLPPITPRKEKKRKGKRSNKVSPMAM